MLHTLKDLEGFVIQATDDNIGEVKDFYFDDNQWVIRYLIVETGSWLSSRKVLLSPISIKQINYEDKTISVSISRKQVEDSPSIDTQKPVSRQYEIDYLGYYGYPMYWGGFGIWGGYASPYMIAPGYTGTSPRVDAPGAVDDAYASRTRNQDHHLRSYQTVTGYHLEANDGSLGHVQGMLIDTETWAIRYLIIDTSNWLMGHLVLISPQWIEEVSWTKSKFFVDMTQQQVKDAPLFDPAIPVNRELEKGTHFHYGRKGYWEE